jgi:deoxyribodipyrimidine photo-lyase
MLTIFWFRRDLRLFDNSGLYHALKNSGNPVLPLFIFDTDILEKLSDKTDHRVNFIYNTLKELQVELSEKGSTLLVKYGKPLEVYKKLVEELKIDAVYTNYDYEPYAIKRDTQIENFLKEKGITFQTFKDQVIFEKNEILSNNKTPYSVFTPYSKKWKSQLNDFFLRSYPTDKYFNNFYKTSALKLPSLPEIGFQESKYVFPAKVVKKDILENYAEKRNFPAVEGTSRLSLHLRFGTISIRNVSQSAYQLNETFLNELIWRDFYMMILYHFPVVETQSFRSEYARIKWRNNEEEFKKWCEGKTGYPLVDAGMRQLNETGWMHNRVRMITASFLIKHLLIDWRWGESYFAKKLLDYDLAANNGGWQWVAGCGTDAAPYFRIFNPTEQTKKFDPDLKYIKKWIPEWNSLEYPKPLIEHTFARERTLKAYKKALEEEK